MYSLTDYTFPDEPFMIALGTSHTCGDCDGPTYGPTSINITAYDMIANELELELVKIGLSGCKNEDLLQATNELAHHKALNDNCKLFMLEPRLGDRTVRIPVEVISPDVNIELAGSGILAGWANAHTRQCDPPTIQQVAEDTRFPPGARFVQKYGKPNLPTKTYMDASIFYAHSTLDIFNSVTIIDSIRHIVEANNVKFKWQVVSGHPEQIKLTKKLLGKHSTLFDNFINILDIHEIPDIKCGCGHYNKQGHRTWYENTIDHLR